MIYRVVSVEDDPGIYQIIKASLKRLPLELQHAGTGKEAVALIKAYQPHLVVLDISLPDMNGWDVLQQITDKSTRRPEIIVLTAFTDPTHRLIGHLQDVTYMSKPFLPRELSSMVIQVLGLPTSLDV
jgi:DNA-binding response OmpR family regulator